MALESATAQYIRAIAKVGEPVQFQRNTGAPNTPVWTTYGTARCRVVDYDFRPTNLAGSIAQDERMLIALYDDLAGVPQLPPKKGDRAIVRGKASTIEEVDQSTRRIAGVLLAYEIRIKD